MLDLTDVGKAMKSLDHVIELFHVASSVEAQIREGLDVFVCLFVFPFVCMSVCLSSCLFVCLFVSLSVSLSISSFW